MVLVRKLIHELAGTKEGTLAFYLNAFIGAYNRRTDVMERQVKLDERIRGVTQKLDAAGESLKQTVKDNQPKGDTN